MLAAPLAKQLVAHWRGLLGGSSLLLLVIAALLHGPARIASLGLFASCACGFVCGPPDARRRPGSAPSRARERGLVPVPAFERRLRAELRRARTGCVVLVVEPLRFSDAARGRDLLARAITSAARGRDLVAELAPSSFGVLMPGASQSLARGVAGQIQRALGGAPEVVVGSAVPSEDAWPAAVVAAARRAARRNRRG
jgi:hypothetical protein